MRWSKAANSSASRRTGPPSGCLATSRGAGVRKLHETPLARAPPVALVAPAATVARYSLAIAKRPSGSNTSVRVPIQRHSPLGCGSSRTGTPSCASPACESSATIGCENVTESCGASGTSPSGERRSTVSGPVAGASVRDAPAVVGGNGVRSVRPGRGGGSDGSRSANGVVRGSCASGGRRSSDAARGAQRRASWLGDARRARAPRPRPAPSLRRKPGSAAICPAASPVDLLGTNPDRGDAARGPGDAAKAIAASRTSVSARDARDAGGFTTPRIPRGGVYIPPLAL